MTWDITRRTTSSATHASRDVQASQEPLTVTVVWGDLTRTPADIHLTGHYYGVMPSASEKALDLAISPPGSRGVIAEHTRRRWLTGMLGQLTFFPAPIPDGESSNVVIRAAVAGMASVGTFTQANAARLYESVIRELDALGYVHRAATVAIGAGIGNLSERQVAVALMEGCHSAVEGSPGAQRHLKELVVVESDRLRAEHLHRELTVAAPNDGLVSVTDHITGSAGGRLGPDAAAVHAIRALLVQLSTPPDAVGQEDPATRLLACVSDELREQVRARLLELSPRPSDVTAVTISALSPAGGRHGVAEEDGSRDRTIRVTATATQKGLVWAALTDRATVPEREVSVDITLLHGLVQRLTGPTTADATDLPAFMTQFLVPPDLQSHLTGDAPLIIEVDRETARIPWEFLMTTTTPTPSAADAASEPLVVRQCFARQLRTSYARTDIQEPSAGRLRALVVGDPDAARNHLPYARAEAVAVADELGRHSISVDLFLGPADDEPSRSARSASRLDVLAALLTQRYDVLHFAGHGVFNRDDPELSGWLFADGVLTARELRQLSTAPRLVFANACWSAARPGKRDRQPAQGDSGELAPVLADEFFRVGVGHFVGATWAVLDDGAELFASCLYGHLLGDDRRAPQSVGRSVLAARRSLWDRAAASQTNGAHRSGSWAAYQYYGDPSDYLLSRPAAMEDED